MLRKLFCILSVLVSFIMLFSSCSDIETVELNQRLIIEAVGIDSKDGKYEVTIEGLDSFTVGSTGTDVSSENITRCYFFEGETIGMAMNQISVRTGLIPLFSQARVLVIGKKTAETELQAVLDFFRREYTTRTDILIAVSDTTAKEVLSSDFGKSISAGKIIETALDSGKHTSRCIYMPLYKFLNNLKNEASSAFCPLICTKKNEFSELYEIDIHGTAVFYGDKSTVLTSEETLALSVFLNKTSNGDLSIKTDKGVCTVEIIDCDTRIKTETENGKIHFLIENNLRCDIPEFLSPEFSSLTPGDTEKIAFLTAQHLAEKQAGIIDKFYFGQKFDIFNFGRRIDLKNHKLYTEYIRKTDKYRENVICDIKTSVSVRRIGKILLDNSKEK